MILQHNQHSSSISIYIHWPFCKSKCPYCDFNSHVRETINYSDWLKAYIKEINFFQDSIRNKKINSIFFGGGTPSLMPPYIVDAIINEISKIGKLSSSTEITLEANPTSSDGENFVSFKQAGINRLSIGVQALSDKDLKFLGREHSSLEAIKVIELARSIFENYSFDIIYARPGQSIQNWLNELGAICKLAANHLSLYQLTIEKGTAFYSQYNIGKFTLPSNDLAGEMLSVTSEFLFDKGFTNYEISNFAKAGLESVHNLAYWNYQDYIGIGPGAHSRISTSVQNKHIVQAISIISKPENWLKMVENQGNGIQIYEILTKDQILTEILMMGFRLKSGIDLRRIKELIGDNYIQYFNIDKLELLEAQGLIERSYNNIKLSTVGLRLLNSILLQIL